MLVLLPSSRQGLSVSATQRKEHQEPSSASAELVHKKSTESPPWNPEKPEGSRQSQSPLHPLASDPQTLG
ncbi:hypothetical protein QTO34_017589 [Cnephaeus nilssonii]|uniref:Uncharacterized protein n=1 Tax=Cnephaeus nilssonii TaxID=3371016 RepID=A0AA40I1A0_CNENI|nr:hypothetical protein QTO34_017589 [Eptesicus nilssonii]